MWILIALLFLVPSVISKPLINQRLIKQINQKENMTWTAEVPEIFKNLEFKDFQPLLLGVPKWNGEITATRDAKDLPEEYIVQGLWVGDFKKVKTVAEIQHLIFNRGPLITTMSVFADLLAYKSGVYIHETGALVGAHRVKIVGWGYDHEHDVPFWYINPQWDTQWGENGLFRMLRGVDECGLESN